MKNLCGVCVLLFSLLGSAEVWSSESNPDKPNIVYLMLDEWGYFESGHMGHTELLTPHIDQFAAEGMRFTNALTGSPVCGPTRAVLLTGLHSGHTSMRSNNGFAPIRADEPTLASMLKASGYATGGFGKWGIGGRGTTGLPEEHGFDVFYGYYDQVHAHTFYPEYLIRNSEEVPLPGNSGDSYHEGQTHAHLEIFRESMDFIREQGANQDQPFFAYLPWTPPHGQWGIDEDDPSWQVYKDKPWNAGQMRDEDVRIYAAFMHMVDRQIGEIISLLKELGIDDNTVFFLSGDNGGQEYFRSEDRPHGFFAPNLNPHTGARFRGGKGRLYEGGLKIPYLVRWPSQIPAGSVCDHVCYFPDVMPTLADLTSSECPSTDGISFAPSLKLSGSDAAEQKQHDYLYWEYGGQVALRRGDWKIYRKGKGAWELYDLSKDIEELNDLSQQFPDIVKEMAVLTEQAHEPMIGGEVFDEALIEKDRRQSPNYRKRAAKKK